MIPCLTGAVSDPLVVRHWVAASPTRVWEAYFTPEQFHRFFSPEGLSIPLESVVIEPRVGGRFACTMVFDDTGVENPNDGTLLELDPPHRFVGGEQIEGIDGEFRSTWTFDDEDGGTLITVVQEGLPDGIADNPEVHEAFRSSYRKLGRLLGVDTAERPCG
jgi:uncharacterized protein YndB with AHSA1/START domain